MFQSDDDEAIAGDFRTNRTVSKSGGAESMRKNHDRILRRLGFRGHCDGCMPKRRKCLGTWNINFFGCFDTSFIYDGKKKGKKLGQIF